MVSHLLSKGLSGLCCCLRSRRLELLLRAGASRVSLSLVGLRIREYVFPARYLAAEDASGAVKDVFLFASMVSSSYVTWFCFASGKTLFCSWERGDGGKDALKRRRNEIQGETTRAIRHHRSMMNSLLRDNSIVLFFWLYV